MKSVCSIFIWGIFIIFFGCAYQTTTVNNSLLAVEASHGQPTNVKAAVPAEIFTKIPGQGDAESPKLGIQTHVKDADRVTSKGNMFRHTNTGKPANEYAWFRCSFSSADNGTHQMEGIVVHEGEIFKDILSGVLDPVFGGVKAGFKKLKDAVASRAGEEAGDGRQALKR
jgi:hypothetical protein